VGPISTSRISDGSARPGDARLALGHDGTGLGNRSRGGRPAASGRFLSRRRARPHGRRGASRGPGEGHDCVAGPLGGDRGPWLPGISDGDGRDELVVGRGEVGGPPPGASVNGPRLDGAESRDRACVRCPRLRAHCLEVAGVRRRAYASRRTGSPRVGFGTTGLAS